MTHTTICGSVRSMYPVVIFGGLFGEQKIERTKLKNRRRK